jgi:hypothetical protein
MPSVLRRALLEQESNQSGNAGWRHRQPTGKSGICRTSYFSYESRYFHTQRCWLDIDPSPRRPKEAGQGEHYQTLKSQGCTVLDIGSGTCMHRLKTDAGEEQEKARSKTRSRGNHDVTRILAPLESEFRSGLPRVEHQNSKLQQHRLLNTQECC